MRQQQAHAPDAAAFQSLQPQHFSTSTGTTQNIMQTHSDTAMANPPFSTQSLCSAVQGRKRDPHTRGRGMRKPNQAWVASLLSAACP